MIVRGLRNLERNELSASHKQGIYFRCKSLRSTGKVSNQMKDAFGGEILKVLESDFEHPSPLEKYVCGAGDVPTALFLSTLR